ncbi:MAG: elongation factor G, partial [Phototrophicales bacterium]
GSENDFSGIIDLVRMRATVYKDDLGQDIEEVEIPSELLEQAQTYRAKMIEALAETDERLLEKFMMEEEFEQAEIKAALRKGTIDGSIMPMLCGSAFKNKG